jgi:GT2 family glycosyltransferase
VDDGRLGIVVLTHGSGETAIPLLRSLLELGRDPAEIVVVHNPLGAGDGGFAPPDAGIEVLRMPRNLGYAAGMNAGIRLHLEAGVGRILLLTHDVRMRDERALDGLLGAARAHPDFGVLGPALWWRSEDVPYSYGGVHDAAGIPDQRRAEAPRATVDGIAECDWVEGAVMLIKPEVFDRIGLFEERFFLYFEETEFCLRARLAGARVGVVLASSMAQEPGRRRWPGAYAYLLTRNGLEYARRLAGWRGVRRFLRTRAREASGAARVLASPRSNGHARQANRLLLAALGWGVLDFARGRWGPPPARLSETPWA